MGAGNNIFSKFIIVVILMTCTWIQFDHQLWRDPYGGFKWDVTCYYMYLPAVAVYGDLTLEEYAQNPRHKYETDFCTYMTEQGDRVMKVSSGLAFLYAPFFYLAHYTAPLVGAHQDGYSPHYGKYLNLSVLFYLAIGLWALLLVMRRHFKDGVIGLSLLAITLGTNLLYYATLEACMGHVYSFSLIAVAMLLISKWHQYPNLKKSIGLGLLIGLIALIRPTNLLIVVVFFLYGVSSFSELGSRLANFWRYKNLLLVMALSFVAAWMPQFIYWKMVTGNWLYYSYGNESFDFLHPHIFDGLFSYRKGWLLYTPIMIFALVGIPLLYKYAKQWLWPLAVFVPINIYVIFSWWSWWYGGSYGQRPMIDSYALMALPMAALISYVASKGRAQAIIISLVIVLFISHNLFQTAQRHYMAIIWDGMTKEAYWDSFMHLEPSDKFWKLVD